MTVSQVLHQRRRQFDGAVVGIWRGMSASLATASRRSRHWFGVIIRECHVTTATRMAMTDIGCRDETDHISIPSVTTITITMALLALRYHHTVITPPLRVYRYTRAILLLLDD